MDLFYVFLFFFAASGEGTGHGYTIQVLVAGFCRDVWGEVSEKAARERDTVSSCRYCRRASLRSFTTIAVSSSPASLQHPSPYDRCLQGQKISHRSSSSVRHRVVADKSA